MTALDCAEALAWMTADRDRLRDEITQLRARLARYDAQALHQEPTHTAPPGDHETGDGQDPGGFVAPFVPSPSLLPELARFMGRAHDPKDAA